MISLEIPKIINYEFCISFVGKKIEKWLIKDVFVHDKRIRFKTICECGKESMPIAYRVFKGYTSSCASCASIKHGKYKSSTWHSWSNAKNRCLNKNNKDYENYGGRGISFYEGWHNFDNFLKDMGEKPKGLTLDRINNNGNYEPGNCRWATYSEQNSNQRKRYSLNKGVML
jgi:hypothetical protein